MSVQCTCIRLMGEGRVKGGDDGDVWCDVLTWRASGM